jgi:hypothetical protein
MENILDMASKVPLPTIRPTITGSASIQSTLTRTNCSNRTTTRHFLNVKLDPIANVFLISWSSSSSQGV